MRHVTESLSIGNATEGRQHGADFDRVVSLAAKNDATTHWHPLPDGPHPYAQFEQAVDAVCDGLAADEQVLVHCQAGISRSVAVAIAALVVTDAFTFDEAYDACRSGFAHPADELVASAEQYIETT